MINGNKSLLAKRNPEQLQDEETELYQKPRMRTFLEKNVCCGLGVERELLETFTGDDWVRRPGDEPDHDAILLEFFQCEIGPSDSFSVQHD